MNEIKSYIPSLQEGLDRLRTQPMDPETIQEIHRLVHIIRGAASLVGIQGLGDTASQMETALEEVMDHTLDLGPALLDAMGLTVESFQAYVKDEVADEADLSAEIQSAFMAACGMTETDGDLLTEDTDFDFPAPDLPDPLDSDFPFEEPDIETFLDGDASVPDVDPFGMEDEAFGDPEPAVIPPSESCDTASEFKAIFYEEAEAHFETINKNLERLEARITKKIAITQEEREIIREIRRAVHTLKGASGLVGMTELSQWAHSVEDLLDWLFDAAEEIDPDIVLTLLKSADILELFVSDPDHIIPGHMDALKQEFKRITEAGPGAETACPGADEPDMPGDTAPDAPRYADQDSGVLCHDVLPHPEPLPVSGPTSRATGTFRVSMDKLDTLVNLSSEQIIALSAFDQELGAFHQTIGELESLRYRLRTISRNLEVGYEVKAIQQTGTDAFMEFDTLELDRYSEFNLIIRALAESVVDMGEITNRIHNYHRNFDGYITRQHVLLGELQTKLMTTRMAPMSVITTRMRRTVREVADTLGKKIGLIIEGEGIELDRVIWEKLTDPLLHILRNAADHGIESPELRRSAGKPETGTILVSASRQGNQVQIRIQDDGAGLNFHGIRSKAQALFGMEKSLVMDEAELADLVFMPGFSTRQTVTQISGRGMGMDIVRNNISELKGTVRIFSGGAGQGTVLMVHIPLTLALVQAVICKAGDRSFAIPLNEISDILRVSPENVIHDPVESIVVEKEILPLYRLSSLLGIGCGQPESENPIVLKVRSTERPLAFAVDSLVGQQEIVIKSLGSHLQYVKGISGATVRGDGSIVPILNIAELLSEDQKTDLHAMMVPDDQAKNNEELEILIVDDSVSIRHVVSRLLQSLGYKTIQARDGMEALEKLSGTRPALIVLDIEMPRMNGYEFLAARRSNPEYRDIPAVILTSRSTAKFRDKAEKLGANGYLVKPFNHEEFISTIRRMTVQ